MKNQWRGLKVLQPDYWMLYDMNHHSFSQRENDLSSYYTQIDPVFNRPGQYLIRTKLGSKCWFELSDGRAFTGDAKMFVYRMNILNAAEHNVRQIAAIQEVVKQKVASVDQAYLLYHYEQHQNLKRQNRESRRTFIQVKREMQKQYPQLIGLFNKHIGKGLED